MPSSHPTLKLHPDDDAVVLLAGPRAGHRVALRDIPPGEVVRQYGQPAGVSRGIRAGQLIGPDQLEPEVPGSRALPDSFPPPPPPLPPAEHATFAGFRRPDGRAGTRNWVAVIPTSMCAATEAARIAFRAEQELWRRDRHPSVDGVTALVHDKGCGCSDGSNLEVTLRTLAHCAAHPNAGAVLFLDLGCEKTNLERMRAWLGDGATPLGWDKPVAWLSIQETGGTAAAVARGLEQVEHLLAAAARAEREPIPAAELVLGLKCGGSDGLSGVTANPALGHAADLLVRQGGTALLTEVPEFVGAEHLLAARAKDAATARAVYALVDWYHDYAAAFGARAADNPSPGNLAGGLFNIALKSLGAIAKGGTTRVEGVTGYAEPPAGRGLQLMQGPGYDQMSTPGLVAAGAQIVAFTTGRGTTIGNALAPVVKIASNTPVFERMRHDLDLDAGPVAAGAETIAEAGRRILDHLLRVASGEVPAKAEEAGHREFQIWPEQGVSL